MYLSLPLGEIERLAPINTVYIEIANLIAFYSFQFKSWINKYFWAWNNFLTIEMAILMG